MRDSPAIKDFPAPKSTRANAEFRLEPGIVPIINTPFDASGNLDRSSLERALDQHIRDGIVGCVIPAVASEVSKLTSSERRQLTEWAIEMVDQRIPVIGGASADSTRDVVRFARHAVAAGCRGVLVQIPQRLYRRPAAIRRFVHSVADTEVDFLVLQDLEWNGPGMDVDLIATLFGELSAFRAIKIETVPAGLKYSNVIKATGGQLPVIGGWALSQMIEGLDRGVHAFTPTATNKVFVHVDHLYREGNRTAAVELFERVVPTLAFACQHIDVSIHFLKRYCVQRGLFKTAHVRTPTIDYDRHHARYGDELTKRLIALEDSLPELGARTDVHIGKSTVRGASERP
jgi:dihydrodipicolinate synthase/N-acetylneuraminate lyase